jgi:glycosyltransferase involved in cell wall biosynthesis
MKIMLICATEQLRVEIVRLAPYLAQLPHNFTLSPLVRSRDKETYNTVISQLNHANKNVSTDPIYLKSSNMGFINLLNPSVLFNDFRSIFNIIKRVKPDVVICYYVLHAYPLVVLKKIFKFSLCVVAMGSDIELDNSPLQRLTRNLILRNSDLIFACSWTLKDEIEKEYNRSATVIPSSTDPSFFRPLGSKTQLRLKWGIQPEKRVILNVCLFEKLKAVDLIIRSLQKLDSKDVDLLLAGDGGVRKSLEQLSISLGLQKRVTFLGFRNKEELLELYNIADVFAMVSYFEGLPRALIEAMACGCVPIVTKVGSMPVVVSDGFNGFVINPGDLEKFVERVDEVFSFSEEKRKLMQTRAREAVEADFDSRKMIKRMVDKISDLYLSRDQLIANAP